jgi:hypothetical protein
MTIGKNRVDITGKTYGHLTVRCLDDKVKGTRARKWTVDCAACGGAAHIAWVTLRRGLVTSCGCRPRLSLRGFNLAKLIRSIEQRLCKSLSSDTSIAPEIRFFLEPSGRVVRKDAAEAVIAAKELLPAGDGLFAGESQTWVPA